MYQECAELDSVSFDQSDLNFHSLVSDFSSNILSPDGNSNCISSIKASVTITL